QVYDTEINPAIVAEFAHTVYRFGHSMLLETVDRFDPNFNIVDADPLHPAQDASDHQIGLIAAFLNPLAFAASRLTPEQATGATTLAGKRAAATAMELGGAGAPADRLDFLNSTGIWANTPAGVTTTGLDNVDLWIGGLAEEQMPFGGLLGSTFNFVFENQLEKLQNADRFYYLNRTADLNFLTELENNSFAKLIMANTDATHLTDLALQVNLILEADQTRQFNEVVIPGPDGILGTPD